MIPNGKWKFIIKRREKLLINLINEHNEVAVKVDKLNMMVRRTFASTFIHFSLMKIVSLYLMFNTKNFIMKILSINVFALYFVFGFTITYLLSHQILMLVISSKNYCQIFKLYSTNDL